MLSHESVSMLNTGDTDANVTLTIYYQDREPSGTLSLSRAGSAHQAPAL